MFGSPGVGQALDGLRDAGPVLAGLIIATRPPAARLRIGMMSLAQPVLKVRIDTDHGLLGRVRLGVRGALGGVPLAGLRGRVVAGLVADLPLARGELPLGEDELDRLRHGDGLCAARALERQVGRDDDVGRAGALVVDGAARRRREGGRGLLLGGCSACARRRHEGDGGREHGDQDDPQPFRHSNIPLFHLSRTGERAPAGTCRIAHGRSLLRHRERAIARPKVLHPAVRSGFPRARRFRPSEHPRTTTPHAEGGDRTHTPEGAGF